MTIVEHHSIAYSIEGLREDLKKRKIKQAELARAIGITRGHLSRIVSGEKRSSEEVMLKIKRILSN